MATFLPHTRTIDVYSSPNTHYIVGSVGSGLFRVLFFERTESFAAASLSDVLFADPKLYDLAKLTKLLRTPSRRTTHERRLANREGVDFAAEAEALRGQSAVPVHQFRAHVLLGVVRFLKGYYLVLCTERKRVGYVNGHVVYSVAGTRMLSCSLGGDTGPVLHAVRSPASSPSTVTTAAASAGGGGIVAGVSSAGHASDSTSTTGVGSGVLAMPTTATAALTDSSSSSSNNNNNWVSSWLTRRNVAHQPVNEMEAKYLSLFQLVDLTKGDFFFSYTLDLTNSIQRSCLKERVEDAFCWNDAMTLELREIIMYDDRTAAGAVPPPPAAAKRAVLGVAEKNSLWTTDSWICPLLHGSFQQQACVLLGKTITLTVIARRSRYYAGTRYLKRGINEQGKVANHVEVEQVIEVEGTVLSSFCQVRGSIPTFWSQETSLSVPKPPIKQYRLDPAYKATRAHFTELMLRFSGPITVLNLVRQASGTREAGVGQEYAKAVELLNVGLPAGSKIAYKAVDFKAIFSSKRKHQQPHQPPPPSAVGAASLPTTTSLASPPVPPSSSSFSSPSSSPVRGEDVLHDVAAEAVRRCGVFFFSQRGHKAATATSSSCTFQSGTARTNCIDNLDRTNAGQLFIGLAALRQQLRLANLDAEHVLSGRLSEVFVGMFDAVGDAIAQQYGGSQAHKKGTTGDGAPHHTAELLTSIRRYYSNSFTDRAKQDAINLFLGCFVPLHFHALGPDGRLDETQPQQALWDLESDFYLHNLHVTSRHSLEAAAHELDVGTHAWWPPAAAAQQQQSSSSPPQLPPAAFIIHQALWDEEDSGFYIKFDQVFADCFFAPQQIAPPMPTTPATSTAAATAAGRQQQQQARTQPLLHLARARNEEEDDEDPSPLSTPSFVRSGAAAAGDAGHSPNSSNMSAMFHRTSLLTVDDVDPAPLRLGVTMMPPTNAAGAARATDDRLREADAGGASSFPLVDAMSMASFRSAEAVARDPGLIFAVGSGEAGADATSVVDPALLEYMEDFLVDYNDMNAVGRIQAKYATTRVAPPGHEFAGHQRQTLVSSLYSERVHPPGEVTPLYAFQSHDVGIANANEIQRNILKFQ